MKYSIKKHKQLSELHNKDVYVLWKECKYGCRGIFQGTKEDCKDRLKEMEK